MAFARSVCAVQLQPLLGFGPAVTTFIILSCACIANAIGDVFMLYGIRYTDWKPGTKAMTHTPDSYLVWGALSGLVTISAWFVLVPHAVEINWAVALLYCWYVGVTLAFHVAYLFVGLGVKAESNLAKPFARYLGMVTLCSFVTALFVSVAWAVDIFSTQAPWWYLLFTPTATIVAVQMLLGRILIRVPYIQVISGPLAMWVFFTGLLSYTGW